MYILIFSMYIQSWKNENTENVMYEYLRITMKSIWVLKYSHSSSVICTRKGRSQTGMYVMICDSSVWHLSVSQNLNDCISNEF